MVTRAEWLDIDADKDIDLVISCEWGGIDAYINNAGNFTKKSLTENKGWWNFVFPFDADNDGDIDLLAGNLGLNSRLKATAKEPVNLYYNDFDENGKKEQLLTYYVNGRMLPFVNKNELEKQLPFIKKKFLYAGDFAKASITEIFGSSAIKECRFINSGLFCKCSVNQ